VTLFTYGEVPVKLHNTFFIIAALYIISGFFETGLVGAAGSTVLIFGLFGSVLLHEMGHVAMAKRFGIRTRSITLHVLGGMASIEREPENPVEEIYIALAGPAVNLLLFLLAIPLVYMGMPGGFEFALINFVMGVFNLVPAYPMDGGRVLKAALSLKMGNRKATEISLRIASIFALAFVIIGLYTGWFGLALVGGFLLFIVYAQKNARVLK
jgi:Zn-dependent protease